MTKQNKFWRKDLKDKFACKKNIIVCNYDDMVKFIEDEVLNLKK